jgi:CheY-like chemotaxis protein
MSPSSPLISMVDDDTVVVQLVTTFLEAHGYRMISCHQSAALPLIHAAQPDLVLLDIQMEQWDAGLQLLAALLRNPTPRRLSVIVCSANLPLLRQQEQSIRELAATTLAKPIYGKLGVTSRSAATRYAWEHQLLDDDVRSAALATRRTA